jgi:oxygen-independent coproporphyrinogen-3 oxidase
LTADPQALAVYIHWPYCARVCPYCDFNVVRDRGRRAEQAALVEAIAVDLAGHARLTGPRRLVSIFFGGGTPSLLDPADVAALIAKAKSLWDATGPVEVTLEANPTDAEAERFAGFAAAGVDRLSLGLQALDDASLAFLGRNHDAATGERAARVAAEVFPRLSLDLIYALPGQPLKAWTETLTRAVDLGPTHLSPYQLTIETGTAFDRAVRRGRFTPVGDERGARFYQATQQVLEARGFEAYEVSNHARGLGARSRHNLAYWRGEDYVGVGPGAHGRLTLSEGRVATQAEPGLADYIRCVEELGTGWRRSDRLTVREAAEERLLTGLRTVEGVPWADLAPLGLSPEEKTVASLADSGMISVTVDGLIATAAGRLLLDRLIAELIA